MMNRPWLTWTGFIFCLAVVLAAMAWISGTVIQLEQTETAARQREAKAKKRAVLEENSRLALWRMDSLLAPLVAQESARPPFVYRAFLAIDQPYEKLLSKNIRSENMVASPLLTEATANVTVHFQFEPDGQITSPQILNDRDRQLALQFSIATIMPETEAQLRKVRQLTDRRHLLAMLTNQPEQALEATLATASPYLNQTVGQQLASQRQRRLVLANDGRGAVEYGERNQAFQQNTFTMTQNWRSNEIVLSTLRTADVGSAAMTPLWIDGELLLARSVTVGNSNYVQGCLLDWQAIERSLLTTIEDLLPNATLEPVTIDSPADQTRQLTALPVQLTIGEETVDATVTAARPTLTRSPVLLSLAVAWFCVLVAAGSVIALLVGVIRLGQRRAAFASAVTHELRTPLTTFCMYTEMLAEGMVIDEQKRQHYLRTLCAESSRLVHLVENVLTFSQLERRRAKIRLEPLTTTHLLDRIIGHLPERVERAGMELAIQTEESTENQLVHVNVSAVEQIVLNLVDNACKFASDAADKRIVLRVEQCRESVTISVRDHGAGVVPELARRIFHPFSKSDRDAAHSKPGIGLGLALSRQLAREMGGQLKLDQHVTDGARFVLTLPIAKT